MSIHNAVPDREQARHGSRLLPDRRTRGPGLSGSRLINRNVTSERGRTSMRLEPEMWSALEEICQRESVTMGELIKQIEARQHHPGGRTSAVRVHVLGYFRDASTEDGHRLAGHGDRSGSGAPDQAPV